MLNRRIVSLVLVVVLLALLVPYPTLAQETGRPHQIDTGELRANLYALPALKLHVIPHGDEFLGMDFDLEYVRNPESITVTMRFDVGDRNDTEMVFYLDESRESVSFTELGISAECPGDEDLIDFGCKLGWAAAVMADEQIDLAFDSGTATWDWDQKVYVSDDSEYKYNVDIATMMPISIQSEMCTIVFKETGTGNLPEEITAADLLAKLEQVDTFHFRIGYTEMASEGSVILLAVGDYAADNKEWSALWVLEGDAGSIEYDLWVQGTEHYLRQGNRWVGPEEVIDPDEAYIVFYPMDCRSLPFFGWQFLGPETVFTADGASDEVEGISCHIYTASVSTSSEELRAEACVTDAGLPLQLAISGVLDGEVVIISLTEYVAINEPVTLP